MTTQKRNIIQTFRWALKLRCPSCGRSSIIDRPFHIKHHCGHCQSIFKREEGFFVGAILMNVVMSEFVILVVCFLCLLVLGAKYETVLWVLLAVAVTFPLVFYHHSWSVWLAFDHLVETLPKQL
ncbi:MAG TPA: hypothetical protein VF074_16425 [Pyrinomonadaceae bacterium]